MVNTNFQTLSQDLQMEIMLKMPLESLMTLMRVSKKWALLIRSNEFRRAYLSRSMTRPPRVLFFVQIFEEVLFEFQSIDPLLPSRLQKGRTEVAPDGMMVSQPLRGMICIQGKFDIAICNPGSTTCMCLPRIRRPQGTFFGYDQSRDVFKVLTVRQSEPPQIFTVGSDEQSWSSSWRQITCAHNHAPITEGVFINGVLYYGFLSERDQIQMMSFNVTFEDFNVFQVPEGVSLYPSSLVDYFGKLALYDKYSVFVLAALVPLTMIGDLELWVWEEEAAGKWSRIKIEILDGQEDEDYPEFVWHAEDFYFLGTIGETIIVFESTAPILPGQPHSLMYYDIIKRNLKRVEVNDIAVDEETNRRTFLNHIDSTWLM